MSYQRVKKTEEVFANFVAQTKNRDGYVAWANRVGTTDRFGVERTARGDWTVACAGNCLYSFGTHYLLALRLPGEDGAPLFLTNADPYSLTTSGHQRLCWSAIQSTPGAQQAATSFAAMRGAGVDPRALARENVRDWSGDETTPVLRDAAGKYWSAYEARTPFPEPAQGMFVPGRGAYGRDPQPTPGGPGQAGVWHRLGGLLLNWQGRCLLCALDENNYFVSELPFPVDTVNAAFEALKPEAVREAFATGQTVLRQGEWYFTPSVVTDATAATVLRTSTKKALAAATAIKPLPFRREESNRHLCRHFEGREGCLFAAGTVRHARPDGTASGEHRALRLPEGWWRAHRNTEKQAWTLSAETLGRQTRVRGRFD